MSFLGRPPQMRDGLDSEHTVTQMYRGGHHFDEPTLLRLVSLPKTCRQPEHWANSWPYISIRGSPIGVPRFPMWAFGPRPEEYCLDNNIPILLGRSVPAALRPREGGYEAAWDVHLDG
jgi:hypothetical protein